MTNCNPLGTSTLHETERENDVGVMVCLHWQTLKQRQRPINNCEL